MALAVGGVSLEFTARAQSNDSTVASSTRVQLDFDAPSPCAERTQFIDRVHARSERIQFTPTATKQLTISVQGEDANWTGRASFNESDQESVSRQITARSCEDVVDGLALVTVMVLDPEAMQRASSENRMSTEPLLASSAPIPPAAIVPPRPKPIPLTEPDIPGHLQYGIDAIFAGFAGPAPSSLIGLGASIHASWVKPRTIWSPMLRLSYTYSTLSEYGARAGTANFTLDNFAASGCPIALRAGTWGVRPCMAASLGQLTASGTRTFVPVTEHLMWAEVDTQIEISWSPIREFEVFVSPALGLALKRYSFSFQPYRFYQEPPVILSGTAGVGLQFE